MGTYIVGFSMWGFSDLAFDIVTEVEPRGKSSAVDRVCYWSAFRMDPSCV